MRNKKLKTKRPSLSLKVPTNPKIKYVEVGKNLFFMIFQKTEVDQ